MKKWIFLLSMFIVILSLGTYIVFENAKGKPLYNDINVQEFTDNIEESKYVVYVHKTSCPACQQMKPEINKVIDKHGYELDALNIENSDESNINFLKEYEIDKVPSIILYENGEEQARIVGYHDKEEIIDFVK
ncbi:thioredoxin family protein [Salibacterium salarium]|uniref:thioredoxin family protein n=1 Tax=Salibacterium salarium TaxID=284579 RepID=UPI00163A9B17|nr:thioredoxin family protein [Salibacterium salarium]